MHPPQVQGKTKIQDVEKGINLAKDLEPHYIQIYCSTMRLAYLIQQTNDLSLFDIFNI